MAKEKIVVNNIKSVITDYLNNAQFNIYIAVAWITDKDLVNILISKSKSGLDVRMILIDDEINLGIVKLLKELKSCGAKITCRNIHHKYCIIDHRIIITGSYNWTNMASNRQNGENIVIIEDNYEEVQKLLKSFIELENSNEPFKKITKNKPKDFNEQIGVIFPVTLVHLIGQLDDHILVKVRFENNVEPFLLFDGSIKEHFQREKTVKIKFLGLKNYKEGHIGLAELVK
ncbi:MAG: phospholipase D-like domain-containing protein [Algibacter sp.]